MTKKRFDGMDEADKEELAAHDPHAAARYTHKDDRRAHGRRSGNNHVPGTQTDFVARVEEKRDQDKGQAL